MAVRLAVLNVFSAITNLFARRIVEPTPATVPEAERIAVVPTGETNTEHPLRVRDTPGGLLNNEDFFTQVRAQRALQHTLPMMRLPKPHKVAFTSAQLFAQQRDLATHDYGLQTVLDALHSTINSVLHTDTPLVEFDFTMNFSGATVPGRKVFVANMRHPLRGTVELVQSLGADIQTTWQLMVRDQLYVYTPPPPT